MAKEGWDMENVHFKPKDGVKASHSTRNVMEKLEKEIQGLELTENQIRQGIIPYREMNIVLKAVNCELIEGEIRRDKKWKAVQKLSDKCDFEKDKHRGRFNNFDRDQAWEILQTVKEVKE